jgi:predicted dehydrogenase
MNSPANKTETTPEIVRNPVAANTSEEPVATSVLRVGIAGAGLMGKWHARAAEKAGGKIVYIADLDKNQAAHLTANYSEAQSLGDVTEMLNQKSLDVLHVCTPTESHRSIAEQAIKAGVNLFIEKPLASSARETIYLYDLASKNSVRICPVHQFVFEHCVKKAVNLIPRIGQVIHLQATICSAGGKGLTTEYLDSIAADILPHPLSLFQTLLDRVLPEEDWRIFRPRPGELRISGMVQEISLSIFVSMNSRPTTNSFQIIGTEGTIHLDLFHDFAVLETGKVSRARKVFRPFGFAVRNFSAAACNLMRRTVRLEPAYPGLQQLIHSFYQSIREDSELPIASERAINVASVRDYLISHGGIN